MSYGMSSIAGVMKGAVVAGHEGESRRMAHRHDGISEVFNGLLCKSDFIPGTPEPA